MNIKLNRFLVGGLVAAVCTLPGFAQGKPDNLVKMVTYFPVPYALYNNIYIKDKLDIGTRNEGFELGLGGAASGEDGVSLTADKIFLRRVNTDAPLSTLRMNADVATDKAYFGNTSLTDAASVSANNMTVRTGLGTGGDPVPTVTAGELKTDSINLFDKGSLPTCSGTGSRWQQLTIGSHTGYYLVCCKEEDDCVDCYYPNPDQYRDACLSSLTGAAWCNGNECGSNCGCSCSGEHSHPIENGSLCGCDDGYMIDEVPNEVDEGDHCVAKCSVYSYKTENRQECCPGSDYTDEVCYTDLEWGELEERTGNLNGRRSCDEPYDPYPDVPDCSTAVGVEGAQCKVVENLGYTCNPNGSETRGCCYTKILRAYKHWPIMWEP